MKKTGFNAGSQQAKDAPLSCRDTSKSYNFLYIGNFVAIAIILLVGIDILAGDWRSHLNAVRRWQFMAMLALTLFTLGFIFSIIYRRQVDSQRQAVLKALRESEAYISTILESMNTGIVIIDAD
ncbi:MAG: hypothetical protein Q7T18_09420, partial [Sedimentisphaerales bacterium]|nr:hypothetical protein [Sedimentisphaerales bacterium]